jgi:uncharacterized protein with PIN domain
VIDTGPTEEELKQRLIESNKQKVRRMFFFKNTRKCAVCGSSMALDPVNISRCTRVDKKFKSVWTCLYNKCGEQVWNVHSFKRHYLKVMGKIEVIFMALDDSEFIDIDIKEFYMKYIGGEE